MRFDNNKFRSLNETITHLNQPQISVDEYTELLESVLLALCEELELDPNELLEDFETPGRAAESKKAIKNLSRTRARRLKSWTKHPEPGSAGYYSAEDRFDKANSAKAARQAQQSAERASGDTYGKGGKIVKRGKGPKKPMPKAGDYVYSHYRNATITKAQALKDMKSKNLARIDEGKEITP